MQVIAKSTSVKITPRKVRLVADAIRNLPVDTALRILTLTDKRGAGALIKTLKSAVANAVNNAKLDSANLVIGRLEVQEGQFLKRFHASTRGRIKPYKKRTSHITIVLKETEGTKGTKGTEENDKGSMINDKKKEGGTTDIKEQK